MASYIRHIHRHQRVRTAGIDDTDRNVQPSSHFEPIITHRSSVMINHSARRGALLYILIHYMCVIQSINQSIN